MPTLQLSPRQWARYYQGLAGEVTIRLARRREELIVEHIPMAERIARHVAHMFAPHLDIRDLVQSGCIGLIQAAERYRSEDGPFSKFAYLRVRGAIIDAHKRRAYREELHERLNVDLALESERKHGAFAWRPRIGHQEQYDPGPSAETLAIDAQRQAKLDAAIALLPYDQQEVVNRALAGELAPAIAASYGRSPNWARTRLTAARIKLAEQLQGETS